MARKKQPRRAPCTGTIRYKKGRKRPWEAAYKIGPEEYRYDYFLSATEATAHLDRLTEEARNKDRPRDIAGGSQGVGAFLHGWLLLKQGKVREKTLNGYKYLCELAAGWFGVNRRIDTIRREDADALLKYFAARDFKNVGAMCAVLRQAFKYAEEEDYIKRNPFARVSAPAVEHRQAIALTKEQRGWLLSCAVYEDNGRLPLCPLWHLYSRLGLRRGEGIALLWANIDWKEATVTITQQYTAVGGRVIKSDPKTKKSRRTLPLPADVVELLRALYTAQRKRAAADPDWIEHGLIFAGIHGGPMSLRYLGDRWKKLKAAASIPQAVTIHDLRHSAATILDQSHVPQSTQMALLGHTTLAMNRHYTDHADLEAMRRAVEG